VTARPSPERFAAPSRGLLAALVAYSLALVWILLWPSSGPATTTVDHVHRLVLDLGLPPGLVTGGRVEFALNTLMVAPVSILATLLWPRLTWERCTAFGFVVSGSVELLQGLLLQQRSAQFVDVVANTLGILVGATVGHWISSLRSQ
jgi:hypothetical protein